MKSIRRKAIVVILVILMVAMALSACGGKGDTKEETPENAADNEGEADQGEADDNSETDAEEDPEVEEPEPVEPHVAWVVEPTEKYKGIADITTRSLKFNDPELRDIRRTCIAHNKGYPQQWGEGIIPDSEGGGTISYSPNAIAVDIEGYGLEWGIIDYDGKVLLEPSIPPRYLNYSPFSTPGYVNIYGGIGYYGESYDTFNVLSEDYSTILYSFDDVGGYGVPSIEYCVENGKLYHMDSGYPTLEFSESDMVDVLKDTLVPVVHVSELNGKADTTGGAFYNQGGYAYVDEKGNIIAQEAYYGSSFVNGFYVGYVDKDSYDDHWHDEENNKCAIIDAASGKPITEFIYGAALYFEEGYCPVKRDGKWGFIDESGAEVTEMIFDKVSTLYEGKVAVIVAGNFAIIDLKETLDSGPLTKELVEGAVAEIVAAKEEAKANRESTMRFPEDFVGTYSLTSGAGAWGTSIELHEDGTFEGAYHDSEMGMTGEGYPYGTVYYCTFSGKFVLVKEVGYNTYSVELQDLKLEDEEGKEEIEDGIKFVAAGPFGLEHSNSFIFMGKGADGRNLSDTMRMWLLMPLWMTEEELASEEGLPKSIMINSNSEETFVNNSN